MRIWLPLLVVIAGCRSTPDSAGLLARANASFEEREFASAIIENL